MFQEGQKTDWIHWIEEMMKKRKNRK